LERPSSSGLPAWTWKGRCLPPDQRVLTPDGYRPVAAIDARDAVVTGRGRARLVVGVQSREADEPLYRLRTERGNLLRVTGEHPVLVRRQEGLPEWLPAAALRAGDLVAVFGATSLGGWTGRRRSPDGAPGSAAVVLREDAETYVGLDWAALDIAEASPYRGWVYDLDIEEDHSFVSEGFVLSACMTG
jgi:intein/homing endonuclease